MSTGAVDRIRAIPCLLVAFSSVTFAAGSVFPLLRIEPRAEQWTSVLRLLAPAHMQVKEVTLLGGIASMWTGGEPLLAVVLGFFSVFLPVVKLSLLSMEALAPGQLPKLGKWILSGIARFAMVEVFVVALFVLLAKELPGGSKVAVGLGGWAFILSVILGLIAGQLELRSDRA